MGGFDVPKLISSARTFASTTISLPSCTCTAHSRIKYMYCMVKRSAVRDSQLHKSAQHNAPTSPAALCTHHCQRIFHVLNQLGGR